MNLYLRYKCDFKNNLNFAFNSSKQIKGKIDSEALEIHFACASL